MPGTRVRTTVLPRTIWTRTLSGFRSRNEISATRVGQSHVGEKTLAILGLRIGLGSSFRPSVTANAAAVPPSSPRTSTVVAIRAKAGRF